ncbi:hypothetical protein J416_05008 [Gracilibacillus halophilus YIM-C55.5]|uniref:ABC transporter periplasmic binding protein yphF n=1 Tax=Gracilibacillus halophilus YIM-C55.5 TaxID=1308866 RepID=N4WW84_9BACI|nr:DUF3939 domain-containing protein [Gracilibacillus halophilus]ENH97346.1 hypothetical protein J416_05008 [Gracilibacillus halophilus YIM-C55.5]
MTRVKLHLCVSFAVMILLSGCMYPEENLQKNQLSNDRQLQMVQQAIDQYVKDENGLVPIHTKESDTPLYQKYVIDFQKLKQGNYLQSIPATAFENGGAYQYVLINPETNPTVKVIDIRVVDQLRPIQQQLTIYRDEHIYPPFGKEVAEGIYKLNREELGVSQEDLQINSPYSDHRLPVYINADGELIIDYRMDLYSLLEEVDHDLQLGDDIRSLLTKHHPVVPAYSVPYTIENDEPVFDWQPTD